MRAFPLDLIIALVIGVVLLVQFLYRQLRRKALRSREPSGPQPVVHPMGAPMPTTQRPTRSGIDERRQADERLVADEMQQAAEGQQTAPRAASAGHLPLGRLAPRRFSRSALIPDRRSVQDAIVIAAILQPCHAKRPHDVE